MFESFKVVCYCIFFFVVIEFFKSFFINVIFLFMDVVKILFKNSEGVILVLWYCKDLCKFLLNFLGLLLLFI